MKTKQKSLFIVLLLFVLSNLFAQVSEQNKCDNLTKSDEKLKLRGDHWGYGYSDLLSDLVDWGASSYISINSIGTSVQERKMWELTITSNDSTKVDKHTIYVHVRTHPNEVQSFWVANEMINFLMSEDSLASIMRENCVFHIVPMYNPDGVELEYDRENANDVDIESNWYSSNTQQEVKMLKKRFEELMSSDHPVEIALNLHSAFKCKRYFVFHHINGTSYEYTQMEKRFINEVKDYFYEGIEPWNFFVTWSSGTPKKYPESWWWLNHNTNVLALTYEDGNCEEAGDFDKTAYALIAGIGDYLGITNPTSVQEVSFNSGVVLQQCVPNPSHYSSLVPIEIKYKIPKSQYVRIELFDYSGKMLKVLVNEKKQMGWHTVTINPRQLEKGTYFYRMVVNGTVLAKKLLIL